MANAVTFERIIVEFAEVKHTSQSFLHREMLPAVV